MMDTNSFLVVQNFALDQRELYRTGIAFAHAKTKAAMSRTELEEAIDRGDYSPTVFPRHIQFNNDNHEYRIAIIRRKPFLQHIENLVVNDQGLIVDLNTLMDG